MRSIRVVAFVIALGTALTGATPAIPPEAVLGHIKFLASDELKGRGNGQEGLERAADYVAEQFKAAGLKPGGTNNDWFQPFEIDAGLTIGKGNAIEIRSGGRMARLSLGSGYYPLAATPNDDAAQPSHDYDHLPVVFAGYGISAPSSNYDDYAGLDVKGKAVLIFSHEPQEARRDSRLNGDRPLRETTLNAKATAAHSRGARMLMVVSDPSHQVDQADYDAFLAEPDADDRGIPVLRVRRMQVASLLQGWGLDGIAAMIERDLIPRSRTLDGAEVDYTEFLAHNVRTVRNVVGILPGTDSSREDEAVVIGAHYDHVGLGGRYSVSPERTGEVHNGADDNASGTSAVIEIAKAAAADPSRFARSIVFVAFAGEERGLLGSVHYANNPAVPLSKTVAMLNLDMVGRSNGKVQTSGLEKAPSLEPDLLAAAKTAGFPEVGRDGPGAGRSDDASFLQRRIPSIIFFTGFHGDYHRPGDDWNKIDAPGTARVATLALELAARIASRRDRPAFVD